MPQKRWVLKGKGKRGWKGSWEKAGNVTITMGDPGSTGSKEDKEK